MIISGLRISIYSFFGLERSVQALVNRRRTDAGFVSDRIIRFRLDHLFAYNRCLSLSREKRDNLNEIKRVCNFPPLWEKIPPFREGFNEKRRYSRIARSPNISSILID
jgi:hypothetical protein